jgi:hypothetical protein
MVVLPQLTGFTTVNEMEIAVVMGDLVSAEDARRAFKDTL